MTFQPHPYAVVLVISALTVFIATIIILRRDVSGSLPLGGVLLSSFLWSASYAMIWLLVDLDQKIAWLKIMHLGAIGAPTLFLIFVLRITRNTRWLTARNLLLLGIEPLLALSLVWSDSNLFFEQTLLEQQELFTVLRLQPGLGYWLNTFYVVTILILALGILGVSSLRANPFFRRQYIVILLSSIIPYGASAFIGIIYAEKLDLNLTPVAFGVSGIFYVYAIFRYQFMDLLPVARGRLIESMSDGVLVVDGQGRIVDINPAMQHILNEDPSAVIGKYASDILDAWGSGIYQLLDGMETRTELRIPHNPSRYLDLRFTPLYDEKRKLNGRLIVFRDVTDRKDVERDLRRANDRLQTQLIEIGILQSQLREQAIRDALTNVFNRRYLEETLERELARAARENYPLCAIMMDLDYFKDVNDTYGHEAGDMVLKTLAKTVMSQSRHGDFVCRYGGEEFVLVMPNIGIEVARERAEELHQLINSMNIPYGVFNLNVTISLGVAMYPDHGNTKEELIRAADTALYEAKNTGRNRVVIYKKP